mgnify:CR=1 FL=1
MGMMHEGYFVGRNELSDWIRGNFDPGFNKIEDLASGVVYCKIINSIHPGSVALQKVKKDAKIEVDFIHNFKILQNAFSKKKIDRFIEVDKLVKKSFQFNMEFGRVLKERMQFFNTDSNADRDDKILGVQRKVDDTQVSHTPDS